METPEPIRLSASKIEAFKTCSWTYYCQYILNLPKFDNDGNLRGSLVHGLLEHLAKEKHRPKFNAIVAAGCPFKLAVTARYMSIFANQIGLDLDAKVLISNKKRFFLNRELVSEMVMVALGEDFYGEKSPYLTKVISEEEHVIFINESEDKRFKLKGLIDKVFLRYGEDGEVVEIEIVDYKTSKSKFDAKKMSGNLQSMIYQYLCRRTYPNISKIKFTFLFLQFKNPRLEATPLSDSEMEGVEYYLSHVSRFLENFDKKKAVSNFAKNNGGFGLCGKNSGNKRAKLEDGSYLESNEKVWVCPYKNPFVYWAVVDKDSNIVRSSMGLEKINISEEEARKNFSIKQFRYAGCPAWHASKEEIENFWKTK